MRLFPLKPQEAKKDLHLFLEEKKKNSLLQVNPNKTRIL